MMPCVTGEVAMKKLTYASIALAVSLSGCIKQNGDSRLPPAPTPVERGRYLTLISGCHDCHTPGYALNSGKVDEAIWLTGDPLGWEGPWGTTYPPNLRLTFQTLTEEQWLQMARTREMRPPMPWFNLRAMSDADLRAMYQFVRSLGPAGSPAPAYLPPGTAAPLPKATFQFPPGPPS
jgi:mono/diheme cytochrome c family protein